MFIRQKTRFGWSLSEREIDPETNGSRLRLAAYIDRSDQGWSLRLFMREGAARDYARALARSDWQSVNGYTFANVSEHATLKAAEDYAEIARALWPAYEWRDARESDANVSALVASLDAEAESR